MGTDCCKAPVIISFKATEYRLLYHVMLEVSLICHGLPRYLDSRVRIMCYSFYMKHVYMYIYMYIYTYVYVYIYIYIYVFRGGC